MFLAVQEPPRVLARRNQHQHPERDERKAGDDGKHGQHDAEKDEQHATDAEKGAGKHGLRPAGRREQVVVVGRRGWSGLLRVHLESANAAAHAPRDGPGRRLFGAGPAQGMLWIPMLYRNHPLPRHFATLLASGAVLSTAAEARAAIRFVHADLATGAGTGTSWADAYRGGNALAVALAASVAGDEIWVARGTYRPTLAGTRTATHTLKTGVGVFGGFAGFETARDQRNFIANPTICTGDLLLNDAGAANLADNSFHVFVGSGAAASAVLDGFTIRSGNANGANASDQDKGGGLLVVGSGAPTIRNCVFISNRCTFGGGAAYIFTAGAAFSDCRFEANVGGSFGGAFDMNNVVASFTRCSFIGNTAARAGACESYGGSQTTYTNCVFRGNSATGTNGGGAIWIGVTSAVTVRCSTFVANSATVVAGCIQNTSGTSTVTNSILWANTGPGGATSANQVNNAGGTTLVSYSIVQGGFAGTQNSGSSPLFVDQAGFDYRLAAGSPAIDSGSNSLVIAGTVTDFDGNPRFRNDPSALDTGTGTAPIVDRGAFERQPPCDADLNWNGSVDAADITTLLGNWGGVGAGDINSDGGVDAQDIAALLSAWGPCGA